MGCAHENLGLFGGQIISALDDIHESGRKVGEEISLTDYN